MAEKRGIVPRGYAGDAKFVELSRGLTPRQVKFAVAYAENPNLPQHELARQAGFAEKSARISGYTTMHNEKVRALIRYLVESKMATLPAVFPGTIEAIASGEFDKNPKAGKLRLDAAKAAANYGGMAPVLKIEKKEEKTITHVLTADEAIRRVRQLGFSIDEPIDVPFLEVEKPDDK